MTSTPSSTSNLYPALNPDADQPHAQNHAGVDYSDHTLYNSTTTTTATASKDTNMTLTRSHTTTTRALATTAIAPRQQKKQEGVLTLSPNEPIPLSTYISVSQVAISSALKVAMVSTSLSLSVARTIVSTLDKVLGMAVNGVVGQNDEGSSPGLNPAFVASLPFRAALLGINFSDILVQTILETVDGSVNLALSTVQDGFELMDSLFGPDSTSQTGETFREVWKILSRELTQEAAAAGAPYPALEGIRLLMAYVAIQFATSERWETIRVRTQGRLVGECLESKDDQLGSSTAWSAIGTAGWPEEWAGSLSEEELLREVRCMELREQREGRSAASFSAYAGVGSGRRGFGNRGAPSSAAANPELTNFLADSYRFSRFCSAMYGSLALEFMGAPERYPPLSTEPVSGGGGAGVPNDASEHHFHQYTGTPLGSILYSSDTAATVLDGFYSPRYYLLDDVETKQIVLVLRGTKSLHDLMIDLTCDAADLWLDHDTSPLRDAHGNILPNTEENLKRKRPFRVHGGFLKAARTIASAETIGIQEKVKAALEARPEYSLLLIGHSLGAGIASVLSMLWADPATGLTPEVPHHSCASRTTGSAESTFASPVASPPTTSTPVFGGDESREWYNRPTAEQQEDGQFFMPGYLPKNNVESFLPPGRRVKCYGYGTPKVMCPRMSKRALKLVTTISYGDDVVGRLSLGSVRNIGHAMRALLAMRPQPPPSPPASPPSSPLLNSTSTSTEIDLLHDSSESLEDLLEQEGEGISINEELRAEAAAEAASAERHKQQNKKPAPPSIGLEIVQKVIRWRLTGEESLLEEFMDIRRAMHKEMMKHQDHDCHTNGDLYPLESPSNTTGGDEQHQQEQRPYHHGERTLDLSKISPVLVPAGKVLWIRPTTIEKELENEETQKHPIDSVLHQFEWDHPLDLPRDAANRLIPGSISRGLQSRLEDDQADSASIRSFKETVRSSLYSAQSSPNLTAQQPIQFYSSPPAAATSTSTSHLTPPSSQQAAPKLARQGSADSAHTFLTTASAATTTSPASLHPGNQNTDKLLYRMYAIPEPENVFDEMLFSRRMWSDHLPLTYEFILAGKHAIPVTSPQDGSGSA
ncbi:hypothetical protein KI688_010612 [Linnemannia hyalina]|uniref:sn-1-specific diacylglycerol lipase n=1 Tax=Linnemannia hyalina TaxID=64524 RepID=A0A9P7XVS8_9FUNG|nr:hypothetical protein KI688_010612 [Linnemannia hyalina]